MKLVELMRRLGSLLFFFMWLPFMCIFVGSIQEYGDFGRRIAASIDRVLPGLLSSRGPDGMSTLTEISLTITIGMSFLAMALIFGSPLLAWLQNRRLLQNGERATATIVSVSQTGTTVNNNPVVRFVLEVKPSTRQPFHAEAERLVSLVDLAKFQEGSEVTVRYDPNSLEVAIEG